MSFNFGHRRAPLFRCLGARCGFAFGPLALGLSEEWSLERRDALAVLANLVTRGRHCSDVRVRAAALPLVL